MREQICNIQFLLGFISAVFLSVLWDKRPYSTASILRLSHPEGTGSCIYFPKEQGGPVIPPCTEFPFSHLLWLTVYGGGILTCLQTGNDCCYLDSQTGNNRHINAWHQAESKGLTWKYTVTKFLAPIYRNDWGIMKLIRCVLLAPSAELKLSSQDLNV
jgi:hypothetical protein